MNRPAFVRYAVGAVEARRAFAEPLAVRFGARLFFDEPPSGSGWANYRRALSDFYRRTIGESDGAWLVFFEDDAIPVDGAEVAIPRALATCPGDFAGLFLMAGERLQRARAEGAAWYRTVDVVHGVAWAIRRFAVPELLAFAEARVPRGFRMNDDILLGWLASTFRHNYCTAPSLVEHRQGIASVIEPGLTNDGRRAAMLPGPGQALQLEWNDRWIDWHYGGAEPVKRATTLDRLRAAGLTL